MIPRGAALLVIDVQKGFDAPDGGPATTPGPKASALARLTDHNS